MNILVLVLASLVSAAEKKIPGNKANLQLHYFTESGLEIEILSKPAGCDRAAQDGDHLQIHYTGTLEDGSTFDSSRDRKPLEPFQFQVGVGQVIGGWEEGVLGMCVGEQRRLVVPPALGYGDQGAGDLIPGGATLIFDLQLMGIQDK